MSDTESDCDWFDKDDDQLMKDLQKTVNAKKAVHIREEEPIKELAGTLNDYIKELTLAASSKNKNKSDTKKISIVELRKIVEMSPLDRFLHAETMDYDFYVDQIKSNDSQERIMLYTDILASICRLELPGFQNVVMNKFWKNHILHECFRLLAAKLFCKRFKDMWKRQKEVEDFMANLELLLTQSFTDDTTQAYHISYLRDIINITEKGDNDLAICQRFMKQLQESLQQVLHKQQNTENFKLDIFPSLEDILSRQSKEYTLSLGESVKPMTVRDYLTRHMQFLKQDFLVPIWDCVDAIKDNAENSQLRENFYVFDDVFIVLNEQFLNANRHELVFVDVMGSRRQDDENSKNNISKELQERLQKLKTGALLCFTTSKHFDNLILATVTYTSQECLKEGFIGIEIARQYNVGNIYNRSLIMFETPSFFEPYHNVFNYLKNCPLTDFPMKKYIIDDEATSRLPMYLKADATYECYGQKFNPTVDSPPNKNLQLNAFQLNAFSQALKREFCLIQGPPGTGKTHLSVQIVKTLIENCETPLILITYTNDSLDKFLVKLSTYTENIVRFGSQTRDPLMAKYNIKDVIDHSLINPKLKKLYYLTNVEFKETFQRLQKKHSEFDGTDASYECILKAQSQLAQVTEKLRTLKLMFQYYAAREKSIIAMTTTCAARTNFLFRLLKSKIVIFEEAAEILESHVVACLTPHTQHVIMIGDHQQLQPHISSYQLQLKTQMHMSLFERIFDKQSDNLILNTQYRMHPKIADLLSDTIYKNLKSDESVTKYPGIRQMSTNLYFMTHQTTESKTENESSLYNSYEVTQVVQLSQHLVQNALYDVTDIQILSPYAKQIDLIKKQLQKNPALRSIKACTVDSFQGLECTIVILSLVRSNTANQIGFLQQSNRICVALSRAKHGMYIIGNLQLLARCSDIWKNIEQKLLHYNAVGDKFPIE